MCPYDYAAHTGGISSQAQVRKTQKKELCSSVCMMEVIKSVSLQVFKSGNSTFWYSFVFVFIYPFGIPVLFTAMMFYFEVPKIAKVCIVI